VAVAVVAQAVWGMARSLTPDRQRIAIAVTAMAIVGLVGGSPGQIAAILLGGLAGLWFCSGGNVPERPRFSFVLTRRRGAVALLLFATLLLLAPLGGLFGRPSLALFGAFYRAGALVFGGGHVVLPLLRAEVVTPGWVGDQAFLAGYGLAQAVPGPLFSFAAYLGALSEPQPAKFAGAAIALFALFLPGLLLVYGMLPFWDALRARPAAQAAMRGANAAVVGVLALALYSPVWTSAVFSGLDAAVAFAGFLLLTLGKVPPWLVVVVLAAGGAVAGLV
jgi:chromate transporter